MIGPFGAHLSGLLVLLFGAPAFLFPIMIGFAGWLLYRDRSKDDTQSRATLAFRSAGFLITLITSCGLASLHFTAPSYPSSAGGVLGSSPATAWNRAWSFLGATLLLLALWLAGVSLSTGASWIQIMDRIGHIALQAFEWISAKVTNAREIKTGREVKQARNEVVREEQKRVASRPPPKIEPVPPKVEKSERVEKRAPGGAVRQAHRRNCRRCRCWTIRRRSSRVIPPKRSKPCRGWWSSSCAISASRPKSSKSIRGR